MSSYLNHLLQLQEHVKKSAHGNPVGYANKIQVPLQLIEKAIHDELISVDISLVKELAYKSKYYDVLGIHNAYVRNRKENAALYIKS
jgi:hypothetical protein